LSCFGKKNADAEEAQSTARMALSKPLPMKEAFPIGGLLSFPGESTVRPQIQDSWPSGQLANCSLVQKKRELQY
jgi:hypothetical protein